MRILLCLFIFFISLTSCNSENSPNNEINLESKNEKPVPVEENISYRIIFDENIGWGYQIFKGAKMLINQSHIPAIQGNSGFRTKKNAVTTAEFVSMQIKKGVFPPTLTKEILDSLKVL